MLSPDSDSCESTDTILRVSRWPGRHAGSRFPGSPSCAGAAVATRQASSRRERYRGLKVVVRRSLGGVLGAATVIVTVHVNIRAAARCRLAVPPRTHLPRRPREPPGHMAQADPVFTVGERAFFAHRERLSRVEPDERAFDPRSTMESGRKRAGGNCLPAPARLDLRQARRFDPRQRHLLLPHYVLKRSVCHSPRS